MVNMNTACGGFPIKTAESEYVNIATPRFCLPGGPVEAAVHAPERSFLPLRARVFRPVHGGGVHEPGVNLWSGARAAPPLDSGPPLY